MTKYNVHLMINIARRLKELKALITSKNICVTLWTDNYKHTNVGGVTRCEEIVDQKYMKRRISKQIIKLNKEFDRLSDTFPGKLRAVIRRKAKYNALLEQE